MDTSSACSVSICFVTSSQAIFPSRRVPTTPLKLRERVQPSPVILCCSEFPADRAAASEGVHCFPVTSQSPHPPVALNYVQRKSFATFVTGRNLIPRWSAFSGGKQEPLARPTQRAEPHTPPLPVAQSLALSRHPERADLSLQAMGQIPMQV